MTNPQVLAEAQTCLTVLGGAFLRDPKQNENQEFFDGLSSYASACDWPFGSEQECKEAFGLIDQGLIKEQDTLAREYQRLFIGPEHFAAPAWGSVYLDRNGVLYGSSLFELRSWMKENGIQLHSDKKEPEDHVGTMLLLAGWLASEKPELLPGYLGEHLIPWLPRFLELFAQETSHSFYRGLAHITDITLKSLTQSLGVIVAKKKVYF